MEHSSTQPDTARCKEIKRTDPIWRLMRIERGFSIFLSLLLLGGMAYLLSYFFRNGRILPIILGLTMLGLLIGQIILKHIANERHWSRIGIRRLEALRDGTSSQFQPIEVPLTYSPALPFIVSLNWSRRTIIMFSAACLISILLIPIKGLVLKTGNNDAYIWFTVLGGEAFIPLVLLLLLLAYRAYSLRQCIEVDNEGITTRYQGQQYRMRWQDARLFAQYNSGNAFSGRQTFELSNEQVIVRWSKDATLGNFLLKAANNFADHNYYDTLLEQVNAQVAEHTHLPLLRLDTIKPATRADQLSNA